MILLIVGIIIAIILILVMALLAALKWRQKASPAAYRPQSSSSSLPLPSSSQTPLPPPPPPLPPSPFSRQYFNRLYTEVVASYKRLKHIIGNITYNKAAGELELWPYFNSRFWLTKVEWSILSSPSHQLKLHFTPSHSLEKVKVKGGGEVREKAVNIFDKLNLNAIYLTFNFLLTFLTINSSNVYLKHCSALSGSRAEDVEFTLAIDETDFLEEQEYAIFLFPKLDSTKSIRALSGQSDSIPAVIADFKTKYQSILKSLRGLFLKSMTKIVEKQLRQNINTQLREELQDKVEREVEREFKKKIIEDVDIELGGQLSNPEKRQKLDKIKEQLEMSDEDIADWRVQYRLKRKFDKKLTEVVNRRVDVEVKEELEKINIKLYPPDLDLGESLDKKFILYANTDWVVLLDEKPLNWSSQGCCVVVPVREDIVRLRDIPQWLCKSLIQVILLTIDILRSYYDEELELQNLVRFSVGCDDIVRENSDDLQPKAATLGHRLQFFIIPRLKIQSDSSNVPKEGTLSVRKWLAL